MESNLFEIEQDGKRMLARMEQDGVMTIIGEKDKLAKMDIPVRCNHCGDTYDLCGTKVLHRYADCTLYETPCCKKKADDREWKSLPDFVRLPKK